MTIPQKATVATVMFVLAMAIGVCFFEKGEKSSADDEIERQARETALWLQISQSNKREIKGLKSQLAAADGTIAMLEGRAVLRRARVVADAAMIKRDTIPVALESFNVVTGDTTQLTRIRRRDIDTHDYVVPLFMWESWQNAVEWALMMDTLVVRYKERDALAGVLVAALDHQLETDSSIISSQRTEISWWQRKEHPRCGKRCGIAIGIGGTVLAALAVRQVQTVLSRDHGGAVYPLPYNGPRAP